MNEAEFKLLFEKHAEEIRNFLYYKCGDLQEAQDMMQESFLRLWKNRSKVDSAKALPYLYTIGKRLFLDLKRHDKVIHKFFQRYSESIEQEDPHFLVELSEFQKKLEKTLADMPEKWRTVFLLNRIDRLTYKEIAKRLNLSVKAVEKRMHNALRHLHDVYPRIK